MCVGELVAGDKFDRFQCGIRSNLSTVRVLVDMLYDWAVATVTPDTTMVKALLLDYRSHLLEWIIMCGWTK